MNSEKLPTLKVRELIEFLIVHPLGPAKNLISHPFMNSQAPGVYPENRPQELQQKSRQEKLFGGAQVVLGSPMLDDAGFDERPRPHSNTPPLEILASSSPSDVEDGGPFLMTSRPTRSPPLSISPALTPQKFNKAPLPKTRLVFHVSFLRGYVKLLNVPLSSK